MSASTYPVGNTVVLKLSGLRNRAGSYQNAATVTLLSLVDRRGQSVSGITYPLTLSYVAASDGDYEAEISYDAGVVANNIYKGRIRAESGGKRWEGVEKILAQEPSD